ncbi:general secretion pathway protein M [Parasphingorhabdus marina DSM 22363]|uniref:General secretion pathway protein M n=1 Tax=Parasphingorhabdus marina DSM 22363 TaxID=1123272 RepID=A0A1N6CXM6_9SPHN|nr:type II secretion system protein GspM [Parasphingorhabdus marina]SIN63272.1 general secretion pathway protein M [Parasphingorhabdus marina DSM 22363]
MMTGLRDWFAALSQREKIMIGILAVLVALTVAWYGIYKPFSAASEAASIRYHEAVERQTRMEAKVTALTAPAAEAPGQLTGSINAHVSRRAGEAGFEVGRLDAQANGGVDLVIDSARPTALFAWLSELEREGVAVTRLSVEPAAPGTVTATIGLRARDTSASGE